MYTDKNNQINPSQCSKLGFEEKMECVITKVTYDNVSELYGEKIDNLRVFSVLNSERTYEITERSLNQLAESIFNASVEVICTFTIPPVNTNSEKVNIKVAFTVNLWNKNMPLNLEKVISTTKDKVSKKIKKYEGRLF